MTTLPAAELSADKIGALLPIVKGPYRVNYNDPNVTTTGVHIFDLAPGETILSAWLILVTQWSDAGGAGTLELDAGSTSVAVWEAMDGLGVAGSELDVATVAGPPVEVERWAVKNITAAAKAVTVVAAPANAMTAGAADFYALVLPTPS